MARRVGLPSFLTGYTMTCVGCIVSKLKPLPRCSTLATLGRSSRIKSVAQSKELVHTSPRLVRKRQRPRAQRENSRGTIATPAPDMHSSPASSSRSTNAAHGRARSKSVAPKHSIPAARMSNRQYSASSDDAWPIHPRPAFQQA